MPGYTAKRAGELIRYEGLEHYLAAREQGKGVLVLTGHLGAWELSSFYHSLAGYPMGMVIRRLDNPLVDRFVNRVRCLHGNRVIHKDDFARGLIASMRANETVGILMDTNMTPPQGVFVPFFGVEACTASGLARVAREDGSGGGSGISGVGAERAALCAALRPAGGAGHRPRMRSRTRSPIRRALPLFLRRTSARIRTSGCGCIVGGRRAGRESRESIDGDTRSDCRLGRRSGGGSREREASSIASRALRRRRRRRLSLRPTQGRWRVRWLRRLGWCWRRVR